MADGSPSSTMDTTMPKDSTGELTAQRQTLAGAMDDDVQTEGPASGATTMNFTAKMGASQEVSSMLQQQLTAKPSTGKWTKGPKPRPAQFVLQDKDRKNTYTKAGERSAWKAQNSPPEERSEWRDRHQIKFDNQNLHPNYRNYFDRERVRRDQDTQAHPGMMKPNWRLSTDPPLQEERVALKQFMTTVGANSKPHLPHTQGYLEVLRNPANFVIPPAMHDPKFEEKDAKLQADCPAMASPFGAGFPDSPHMQLQDAQQGAGDGEEYDDEYSEEQLRTLSEEPLHNEPWSERHHITWCNERNDKVPNGRHTTSKTLNPMLLRSYFDRMRNPNHVSRCQSEVPGTKNMPSWRLRMDPVSGNDRMMANSTMMASTMSSTSVRSAHSAALDVLKAPTRAQTSHGNTFTQQGSKTREGRWDQRHELVFKNEEVGNLDRCYFDRFKEAPVNLFNSTSVRNLKPTWSLAKDGSPDKSADMLTAGSAYRHTPHGKWTERHNRTFPNHIHTNMKSYFDRPKEAEDMAASRQKHKLTDKEKVDKCAGVSNWALQEGGCQVTNNYPKSLRPDRADSAPALPTDCTQKKKPPAWFSSHGVTF